MFNAQVEVYKVQTDYKDTPFTHNRSKHNNLTGCCAECMDEPTTDEEKAGITCKSSKVCINESLYRPKFGVKGGKVKKNK